MIELPPSRGKLPTKPLFKYQSLIGHKGISTFVGSITQNLADLQDDQRRFVSFMTIQLFTSRIEDRLLIYGQIRRVIQLSDDQLFIKALEEFKPSVYGENYEEENENATHEKGYNASKKRKQAIDIIYVTKKWFFSEIMLNQSSNRSFIVPQIWAIGKKLINRGKKTLKPEHSFVHVIRKHDVDAFNTLCQMHVGSGDSNNLHRYRHYEDYTCLNENNEGLKGILEDFPEVNIVNDVSSDAALDETLIHDRVNGKSVNHITQPDGEINYAVNEDVSSQLYEDLNGKDNEDDGTVKQNDDIESTTNDLLNAQIDQKVEQNEEVVPKSFNPSSGSTYAIHEPKVERRPFDEKLSESVADSS
ncbi:hypothetical protein Tco_0628024 [Tanacetum coccineum]|uniref:Uncharacterized protein n=1 Tax=Tanacetum coccineum TaxID=301880 RepID=A0ABQ4WP28_9ASTR